MCPLGNDILFFSLSLHGCSNALLLYPSSPSNVGNGSTTSFFSLQKRCKFCILTYHRICLYGKKHNVTLSAEYLLSIFFIIRKAITFYLDSTWCYLKRFPPIFCVINIRLWRRVILTRCSELIV